MIGCLSSSFVKFQTILTFTSKSAAEVKLQGILDGMLPKMLPFALVMAMYLYIKKKGPKYLRIIVFTMIFAVALTLLGII
jgi:PTS system mannose-specific IID component/D-glucosaminate-specific PTS system IID component